MGKLAVFKYFSFLMLLATFAMAGFTIAGLVGGYFTPVGHTALAMIIYVLPIFIIIDVILLLYWLVRRRWHWAVVPAVVVLASIPYGLKLVQPFPTSKESDAKSGLKVATYNVARFNRETTGFIAQDILAEMRRQKVDVFCIQEYVDELGDKRYSESYKEYFPYMAKGREDMVIYSRYPIRANELIDFEMTNNSAMWADIDMNGRQFRVYNVHLETTGINSTKHSAAKMYVQGLDVENNKLVQAFFGNYTMGLMIRSGQAITVANHMRQCEKPMIVCGDFNDVPGSFVYRTLLGDLKDGFSECGSGFMKTFRDPWKPVRIDYIFHSPQMKGLTYYTQELSYSDHYPVFMKMEL